MSPAPERIIETARDQVWQNGQLVVDNPRPVDVTEHYDSLANDNVLTEAIADFTSLIADPTSSRNELVSNQRKLLQIVNILIRRCLDMEEQVDPIPETITYELLGHHAIHAIGGTDRLTPADIGAVALTDVGSLVGPQGPKGDTGAASTIPGPKGDPGTPGQQGPKGDTGAQGSAGVAPGGVIRKTAAQTMTATAQTAVADMSFPVAANSTYWFQIEIVVPTSTGTVPTTNWAFTGPAGATVNIIGRIDTSTSVQIDIGITSFTAFGAQAQVANTGAVFRGVIITGATAGTVQLTAARGGTTPSMSVSAASCGMWLKVA